MKSFKDLPRFPALKVQGKRAYTLARQGKEVQLTPRKIQIYDLQLVNFSYPKFQLRIHCGSGTYVRSLGRDIGETLGSGAIMTALSRVSIGDFQLDNAINLDEISKLNLESHLVNAAQPLDHLESNRNPRRTDPTICQRPHLVVRDSLPVENGESFRSSRPVGRHPSTKNRHAFYACH